RKAAFGAFYYSSFLAIFGLFLPAFFLLGKLVAYSARKAAFGAFYYSSFLAIFGLFLPAFFLLGKLVA
ncbi:hypothetical protein D9A70_11720, partial [Streptococcus agalactiae]|uniref:hypothetical protein n=1 Tax=Streptococcus agalactiae TaxID=1311 RepID=UPI000F229541